MIYREIELPFINFKDKTKTQVKDYFRWFLGVRYERVSILSSLVNESFYWIPDYSVKSLECLFQFYMKSIEIRKLSVYEFELVKSNHPKWVHDSLYDWDFTDITHSIIYDVGIYYGFVFEKNILNLHWEILTKPKSELWFQMPVLMHPKKIYVQPTHIVETIAYKINCGEVQENHLLSAFKVWKEKFDY